MNQALDEPNIPGDLPAVPLRRRVKLRQYLALGAIVVSTLGFAAWALTSSQKSARQAPPEKPVTHKIQTPGPVNDRDIWIAKSEEEIFRLQQDRKALESQLDKLGQDRPALEGEIAKLREELNALKAGAPVNSGTSKNSAATSLQNGADAKRNVKTSTPKGNILTTALPAPPDVASPSINPPELLPPPPLPRTFPMGVSPAAGNKPGSRPESAAPLEWVIPLPTNQATAEEKTVDNYIPAGSFGKAFLLSGLDAPTGGQAQGNPVPFLVKLRDHGKLPNGFRSRIRDCHVVLAGYGDISSERVYARTETLSCVLKDGRVIETTLSGYISGEDGKAGMRGRLISKQGALIARSLVAGIAGGIGSGIAQSYSTISTSPIGSVTTVDPEKIAQQGLAAGFGTSLDRISKWYLERADETYPILEVDAARIGDIVLTKGATLDFSEAPQTSQAPPMSRDETASLARRPAALEGL